MILMCYSNASTSSAPIPGTAPPAGPWRSGLPTQNASTKTFLLCKWRDVEVLSTAARIGEIPLAVGRALRPTHRRGLVWRSRLRGRAKLIRVRVQNRLEARPEGVITKLRKHLLNHLRVRQQHFLQRRKALGLRVVHIDVSHLV